MAFAAIPKIDEELDRLQNLEIISPVDFSDCAAPIVVVSKPDGRVRICADYSTELNDSLEPHQYPIPHPDEVFSICRSLYGWSDHCWKNRD